MVLIMKRISKIYIIGCLVLFSATVAFGQKGKLGYADQQFELNSYVEAAKGYEIAFDKKATYRAAKGAALSYDKLADYQEANKWWAKVVGFDEAFMEITNGTDTFRLIKDCYEPCRKFLFEECETEPGSQRAVFDLESYFDCFFPLTGILDPASVDVSYFETYEDMITGTNPILNLQYENSINPQVIYIRFDDVNTGEFVTFLPIILKAINC